MTFFEHFLNVILYFGFIIVAIATSAFFIVFPIWAIFESGKWYFRILGVIMWFLTICFIMAVITYKGF